MAPPGTVPGSLRVDPHAPKPVLQVFGYSPDRFVEVPIASVADIRAQLGHWPVTWVNVDGLGDETILKELADIFRIHALALEDVVNVHQRAKVEPYDHQVYVVLRMATVALDRLDQEQISIFFGRNYVLTFQERPGDFFDPIRDRIRHKRGRVRLAGADYLAYALIDTIVDNYFPCVEHYGDRIDEIETEVIDSQDASLLHRLHAVRRDLLGLRRAVWPAREAVNAMMRDEHELVTTDTRLYLRDCYDHTVQIIDMLETFRELAAGQADLYLSAIGQRTNEIMKVLTMFTAIFIPLSFIAGVYGMNFHGAKDGAPLNMPELHWKYGYLFALALMAGVAGSLLYFFRRRGWIGRVRKAPMPPSEPGDANVKSAPAP